MVQKTPLILLLALLLLAARPCSAGVTDLLALGENSVVPEPLVWSDMSGRQWPSRWRAAREAVRGGRQTEALGLYGELLARRPELIEARWEWTQLLMVMERYQEAETQLERLLEISPDKISYQQAQGALLLATGRVQRAVVYLARVWVADNQREAVGLRLYQSYMELGEKGQALPVLEVLHRKKADDLDLQQALFRLYVDQGNDQQAQALGAALANGPDVSFDLLLLVAEVHERLGLSHLAAEYWQKVLALQPEYLPAHDRLAAYYGEQGREAKALPHLLQRYRADPRDSMLAGRLGAIYAGLNDHGQALPFLEQYLQAVPDDVDKTLLLAQSYQALGALARSSLVFSRYLGLVTEPADEIRLQAAQVFMETGEKKKAIDQYEHLVTSGGGDKYLLSLARGLSSLGLYPGALARWQQIAAAQPTDLESRLEIVSLLDKLGRREEMVAMLREIHDLDSKNHLVTLRLAEHHFQQGRHQEGWQLFGPLLETEFFSRDFLAIRARILHFLGMPGRAFRDMAEVVAGEEVAASERLFFLEIAGALGRHDVVMAQAARLAAMPDFLLPSGRLVHARALARVGEMEQAVAIYQELSAEDAGAHRVQAHLDAAAMYRLHGFPAEAEQQYRLAWLAGADRRALYGLVDLNLFLGRSRDAEAWLESMPGPLGKNRCEQSIYELRVLNGLEEFDDALTLGRYLLSDAAGQSCSPAQRSAVKVQMARSHWGEGDDRRSLAVLTAVAAENHLDVAAPLHLFEFYTEMGEEKLAKGALAQALEAAGHDAGALSSLMEMALAARLYPLASAAGRHLRDTVPNSFGYLLRFVRVLELNGELDEAYALVGQLLEDHGDNGLLNLFGARLALSSGHFEQGLAMADRALARQPGWPAALLVKARLQWALFRWTEAVTIYEEALVPPVQQEFEKKCAAAGLVVPPQEEFSLWMKVIQPMARPDALQRSLGIDFVMGENYGDVARLAAAFYARYQWQLLMGRELAARNSVKKREYHHAVKQYKALLRDQEDTTLLFDLAGVYSSLDRVGDEAVVYGRLQRYNPDFPGLNEAISRNHLKLQPQTGSLFSHVQQKGRDGYYDIRRQEFGLTGWLSPKPQKEIKVAVGRIQYTSPTTNDHLYANRLDVHLVSDFFDYLQFRAALGGRSLSGGHGSVAVYDFSVTGLAGDRFESYIGVKRQVVTDTLASVDRGVMVQVYEARAELDLTSRLQAGGELRRSEYSDNNEINGYSLWLSSILLPEPHFLKATFLYEFLDAQEKNEAAGPLLADRFTADDHPYWSPDYFWRNHFKINYKHKFSDDILGRSTPSFFTVGYGFSYDGNEDTGHVLQAGLHVEMSTTWILKLESEFEESDEYRTRDVTATLLYRW